MQMTNARNPSGRAKGVGLLIVQVIVAVIMYYVIVMQSMSVAGCGNSCNYALLTVAYDAYLWVAAISFLASLVGVTILSSRGRDSWWAPMVGLGLTVLAGVFALIAIPIATGS